MNIRKRFSFFITLFQDDTADDVPAELFRIVKFKKIIASCSLCMAFLVPYFFFFGKKQISFILIFLILFCVTSYYIAKLKDIKLGTSMFLIALTAACCWFMWQNGGIHDEAILAFPGILIFAVLIANFSLARWLLLTMTINLFAIGLVNDLGIYQHVARNTGLGAALIVTTILVLLTFTIYLTTKDSSILLKKLDRENKKVNESRNEIMRLQNHDPLTGLPNRVLAEVIFKERLQLGDRQGFTVSLMFIDLDSFKSVNDSLGHLAGDKFLQTVAIRLQQSLRETDVVCRFAGDEFVVIAVNESDEYKLRDSALAEKLILALNQPVELGETKISLTASIGIAVAPIQGQSFEELNKKADIAMYSIKESGRNSYRYYHHDMSKDNIRQLSLAQGLRVASRNGELSLYFQSKQMLSDGQVYGAEALLRWEHPELGSISPVEFIPIAENCGAIIEIGEWVLVESIKACAHWHSIGFKKMSISVNVSALQFIRGQFDKKIEATLLKYGLAPECLIVELTESLLFDLKGEHKASIDALLSLGVRLAIDDFGTGYSNLRYLQENNIHILKIDRSFVSKMQSSTQDYAIVETITNMSKTLNMEVVAEGIEDEETKQALISLGCIFGQGYLWNRPLNKTAFIDYLNSQNKSLS